MSKKILMVAYTNYRTDARPRREAETLAARGDSVDFLCLKDHGHAKIETINGVRLIHVSQSRYRGSSAVQYVLAYMRFFLSAFSRVTRLHFVNAYDVVYIHTMPDFMVFTALLPKLVG